MTEPALTAIVVEDEPQIRRFVRAALEEEGWQVVESETMRRGLIDAGTRKPSLVILDLGLPDGDGMQFIRDMRKWSPVPIIVLSARAKEGDKVGALDAGADDYLTKPFGVRELLARVRAATRRHRNPEQMSGRFAFGDVEVDLVGHVVWKNGAEVHLTPTEYRLLGVLIRNAGKVVTSPQLLREVWGPSFVEHAHYVRIVMAHLRQKLEDDPAQPRHLLTETAVGYRLLVP